MIPESFIAKGKQVNCPNCLYFGYDEVYIIGTPHEEAYYKMCTNCQTLTGAGDRKHAYRHKPVKGASDVMMFVDSGEQYNPHNNRICSMCGKVYGEHCGKECPRG